MFFIKAETQGLGFFVAGKPCAGGMVEESLRLFSISLFAFPFLLFPALFLFPALLSLFFCFSFPFLSFCPSFSRSFPLSRFAFPLFLFFFPFPFFLPFFFPLFSSFPLCFPSFIFRFSFPFPFSFLSFCPSFSRSFCLSRFAFPLLFFVFLSLSLSLSFLSVLLFPALSAFPALLSLFFRFSFSFLSFCPSFSRPFHLFRFALCV